MKTDKWKSRQFLPLKNREIAQSVRLLFLAVITFAMASCEVIGGIFKAGVGFGIFIVIIIILIIVFITNRFRKRQ